MKHGTGLRRTTRRLLLTLALSGAAMAGSDPRADSLRRCLQDFDGIEWMWPYQPPMHVRACASPTVTFDAGERAPAGHRNLELIGELDLGPDASHLSSDQRIAALHTATYVHFDTLFRRSGYRRVEVGHGDARTRRYSDTLRALRGVQPLPEEIADAERKRVQDLPPIPYVNLARYVRSVRGHDVTLTYKQEMANTWRITIDGLPSAQVGQGVAP